MMSSDDYGKFTEYGIHIAAERYFWAANHLFVLLSSLIGDNLILYASFQEDALKLNKFIVSVLQHIAVSDLLLAFSCAFPAAASLLTNSWDLGNAMCYASVYVPMIAYSAGNVFIAIMSVGKLVILKYPELRASHWAKKRGHQVCTSIWVGFLITLPVSYLVLGKDDVHFSYRVYSCEYGYNAEAQATKIIMPNSIFSMVFHLLPSCITIGCTIPILKYLVDAGKSARRVQATVPWQGAMAVILTAVVNCVSNFPLVVCYIGQRYSKESSASFFMRTSIE